MKTTVKENLRLALATIAAHRMRSFLTILGVVIGVTCVIVIGSILTGMKRNVSDMLHQFGTETIFVSKWNDGVDFKPATREERMRKEISYADYEAVRDSCASCRNIALEAWAAGIYNARYKDLSIDNVFFTGEMPRMAEAVNLEVAEGHYITEAENLHRANVCVIGHEIAKTFFPHGGAIDKEIRVNNYTCRVIGVLGKFKTFALGGGDGNNNQINIPYQTMMSVFPWPNRPHWMAVQAESGQLAKAMDEVREALRRSRKVPYGQSDNFGLATSDTIIESFDQITAGIATVMVVIGSIGLLVGGVGIMNIMLMSVTERTREIGVRKAIGARRRDIVMQFLLEASTLSGSGGIVGIVIGGGISLLIGALLPKLPCVVAAWSATVSFTVSVSVGLFFGLWPAIKAARLDPVEALRYE